MRFLRVIPALCCAGALILSFLCLFAGHKKGFMEDYSLITVNVSTIGETLLDENRSSSNPVTNLLDKIHNGINSQINDAIGEVAEQLGIEDWYSAHMLDYCFGQYTPVEVANATIKRSDIHKNATGCSPSKAMYKFDPTQIIQDALNNKTNGKITLNDLKWPQDIQKGIHALNALMAAMFVIYVIAIALIAVAFVFCLIAALTEGRISALINFLITATALLAIGIASGLVTAVIVKAANLINKYGKDIGVEARYGGKFLALTWAATGLMLVAAIVWVIAFVVGNKNHKQTTHSTHEIKHENDHGTAVGRRRFWQRRR